MYVPAGRERVEIAGRAGVFLVLSVDRDDGSAEVIALDDRIYLAETVPFSALRPCKADAALDTR